MTWSLVLGGAECVIEDAEAAIAKFGEPDTIVGVKDIAIEYPRIDHWATFHLDRIPKEISKRRSLGYKDPESLWTYNNVRYQPRVGIPVNYLKVRGGSSGLLGALVGIKVADKAILAGIPMDPKMRHFNDRKRGAPWAEGKNYKRHWDDYVPQMRNRVKSMRGWTMELLGEPSREWLFDSGASAVCDTSSSQTAVG